MVLILAGGLLFDRKTGLLADPKTSSGTQMDGQKRGRRSWRNFQFLCTLHCLKCYDRYRKYRRCCYGSRHRWSRRLVLDGRYRLLWYGDQICRGITCREISCRCPGRAQPWRTFYYIEQGMGKKWTWLAKVICLLWRVCVGLFGIGTFSQVNGISSAVHNFSSDRCPHGKNFYLLRRLFLGGRYRLFGTCLCVAATDRWCQENRSVSRSSFLLWQLFISYLFWSLMICNITAVPAAFKTIVVAAFTPKAHHRWCRRFHVSRYAKGCCPGIFFQ